MRFDHYEGLCPKARRMLAAKSQITEVGHLIHPGGKMVPFRRDNVPLLVKTEVIGFIPGAYKDSAGDLHRYTFIDGRVYEEYVQETIHCGGPHYFLALRNKKGRELVSTRWTDKQLKAY
jgi:hypothetical protein